MSNNLQPVCNGRFMALSIYPDGEPNSDRRDEFQKIILCHEALSGLSSDGNFHATIKDLHNSGLIKAGGHIRNHAQYAVSVTLLHELFHCAFHNQSKLSLSTHCCHGMLVKSLDSAVARAPTIAYAYQVLFFCSARQQR
jgi:hypothetical protein